MREVGGTCWLSGKLCTRAACQWDSAIFWCNDNVGRLGAPCATIADYARHLFDHCSNDRTWMQGSVSDDDWKLNWRRTRTNDRSTMQGSVTDDWNWRTIVRGGKC